MCEVDFRMNPATVKDRVFCIYREYQDAVETDSVLLAIYENYFGKLNHQEVSSIKRAGRFWRSQNINVFVRSNAKKLQDQEQTKQVREVYA